MPLEGSLQVLPLGVVKFQDSTDLMKDAEEVRILSEEFEVGPRDRLRGAAFCWAELQGLPDPILKVSISRGRYLEDQLLLVTEVEIERSLGDARAIGQVLDARLVQAFLTEELPPGTEELAPGDLLAEEPLAGDLWRKMTHGSFLYARGRPVKAEDFP